MWLSLPQSPCWSCGPFWCSRCTSAVDRCSCCTGAPSSCSRAASSRVHRSSCRDTAALADPAQPIGGPRLYHDAPLELAPAEGEPDDVLAGLHALQVRRRRRPAELARAALVASQVTRHPV